MSWVLTMHQTRSDLVRAWPAAMVAVALLAFKTYSEVRLRQVTGFAGVFFQIDLFRVGVFLLVVALWRNLWPVDNAAPDFLTRPIPPAVQWMSRFLVLLLIVALPMAIIQTWLVHRTGLDMPISYHLSGLLAVCGMLGAVSALVLAYPGSRNLLGIAILLLIVGSVDQSLFIASLFDPQSLTLRALQWLFVLVVSLAMIHRHLQGKGNRNLFLAIGMIGFLAFSAYPLLSAKLATAERLSAVAATDQYFLSATNIGRQRKLFLSGGQTPLYRLGRVSGVARWANGRTQPVTVKLEGLTGFPASALWEDYRSLDKRGAGELKLSATKENLTSLTVSGYISERQFAAIATIPLAIGDYPVGEAMRVSIARMDVGTSMALVDAKLHFLHPRMLRGRQYYVALVNHDRKEFAMSSEERFAINMTDDPGLLNVGYSEQEKRVQVVKGSFELSRWMENAELVLIAESAKSAGFHELDLDLKPVVFE